MKGNPLVDTRPEWSKWIAPAILALSFVALVAVGHPWIALLIVFNGLVGHVEGYTTALFARPRGDR